MPNTVRVKFQDKEYDALPVEANQSGEYWNQYLLDDWAILKLKTVVTNIFRLIGAYNNDGDPIYIVK